MRVLWFSLALLAFDQASKLAVVRFMDFGQSIHVIGELLKFTYTTNPGMAFGLEVGPKLFLSLFSIVATVAMVVYLWMVRQGPLGYRLALAGVIGGAAGNVIDRTFYGILMPDQDAPLFYGQVVDFFHIDLWRGWLDIPVLGPTFIPLFPIWNVADMAIVIGVVCIILLQNHYQRKLGRHGTREKAGADPPGRQPVDASGDPPAVSDGAVGGLSEGDSAGREVDGLAAEEPEHPPIRREA
jgi:signal peptidase II